jgi:hypothetical protein
MRQQSINFLIGFGIFGSIVLAALKWHSYAQLRRMRSLACPDCHQPFSVPSILGVKRWMEVAPGTSPSSRFGFYLHCPRCAADYRFTNDFRLLGKVNDTVA